MPTQSDQTRWERLKDILHQAMQLTADQRSHFLDEACCRDAPLRREVESLLAADTDARSSFLESGLWPSETQVPADPLDLAGQLAAGQLFEQRYRLLECLGEGGMGQVWLAEQQSPVQRQVALKLIRAGMYDASVVQRFRSERQSLAIMDHPCIAKVFDAGATVQGQPYFVMEYVPGLPITEYCDTKALDIEQRLQLFIKACEGVQHAHQKAIIHRDLKPANILVVEVDGVPTPRIIDFGLARPAAPRANDETLYTRLGQFVGTPGYMAPEQADPAAQDIDTRADVYSLGVILYVLLTGLQPFETKRRQRPPFDEWLRQLRNDDPQRTSSKVSTEGEVAVAAARSTDLQRLVKLLRGDLDSIAAKALSREREHRYSTAAELAADLQRHLDHDPVIARPATTMYYWRKFVRRHRFGVVVAALLGVFAIAASVAGLVAVRKQHEAEYMAMQTLRAQASLLTEVAAARLRESNVVGARRLIIEVLGNPGLPGRYTPAAISVFQEVRAADPQLAVLSGHADRVFSAAFSPDGARIVTASADKTARIWDGLTGAELGALSGHTDRVFCATYSPDGKLIATASLDGSARVWDAHTYSPLFILSGHSRRVDSVAFAPGGRRLVTASWDKTARVWDTGTGQQVGVLEGHGDVIYSAAFSPDGSRIVTASQDKTARVWDANTGKQIFALAAHGDYISSAVYSPDGTQILTASADKTARTWDARTGAPLLVLSGHSDVVYSATYSPDGTRIVTASWDRTARIWDTHSGTQLAVLSGHNATVATASYSPDGTRIVTASQDRTARVWDAHIGAQLKIFSGHHDVVSSAAFSPDSRSMVTASYDGTARIWDVDRGDELTRLSGHTGAVDLAGYSRDGTRIVTASQDKTARIWDAKTGEQLQALSGHVDRVYAAAFSPDGHDVVTASRDKTARIWDAASGARRAVLSGHGDRVYSANYSPDGSRIVTASRDKTARVWDAHTGSQLAVLRGHDEQVVWAAYSPDGTRIVTGSLDNTARIWDAHAGTELVQLSGHGGGVTYAAYSPDGTFIVTASQDNTARLWDAHSGVQLEVLSGHTSGVTSAAFSSDGKNVITGSEDHTARVWDASVPAALAEQVWWYAAAETDPLDDADRARLGLPGRLAGHTQRAKTEVDDRDPNSLARRGAHEEVSALAVSDASKRNSQLLSAFTDYAAAAMRGQLEGLPDGQWRHWRYRQASLARVLAKQGLMSQVADAYRDTVASLSR